MSNSDKPDKKSQSLPALQKVIEIDEGVFGGRISDRVPKLDNKLDGFLRGIKNLELILENRDEEDYDEGDDEAIEEDFDRDEFEVKIASLFGSEDIEVNEKNLKTYLAYLQTNLKMPCHLTGIEDFEWEEYYVFGPGSKKEYEKLKKSRASYTDTFKLMNWIETLDLEDGIFVKVQRISDKKQFTLRLCDLEVAEETSPNYELLDDYAVWFVNYRGI